MDPETRSLPINYEKFSPNWLLARCRQTLKTNTRLAVARLANHLPTENRHEFEMPPTRDISYVTVIVSSPDVKNLYFHITYRRLTTPPTKSSDQPQVRDGILIEIGKLAQPIKNRKQWSAAAWDDGHHHEWARGDDSEGIFFKVDKAAFYLDNQLERGDPSLLARAAASLDLAFATTANHRIKTIDHVIRVAWKTEPEPEEPGPQTE